MNINFVSPRARIWMGAALLTASLGLSSCGGGGTTVPRPTATPVSTVNNVYDKTRFTPNYVDTLERDRQNTPNNPAALVRWQVFPLRVYFSREGFYSRDRQTLALEGFQSWVTATNAASGDGGATFNVVNSREGANIIVNFLDFNSSGGDILGETRALYDQKSRFIFKGTQLDIGITGDRFNDVVTARHEFGHALGINGHSPSRRDLMFLEGNDLLGGGITTADLNTILTSYNNNFNKNVNTRVAPSSGEIGTMVIREIAGE